MTSIPREVPFGLCLAIGAVTPALALEPILTLDFEEGTAGTTVQADSVEVGGGLGNFEGALAQYSDVQTRPGGGSLSLLMQDSIFAGGANQPEVFWNLTNDGSPLDTTRTLKFSYWHYVSDTTVEGSPQSATAGNNFHAILTASDANRTRPEGNGGYLANVWNWQDGPATTPGTFQYKGDVDAAVFPQPLVDGTTGQPLPLNTGTWHRVDNYIPLIDLINPASGQPGGSTLFTGLQDLADLDGDLDTSEFLGYIDLTGRSFDADPNNDRDPDVNVFYSRVLDGALNTLGQTPYMTRRGSDSGVAGEPGGTDPDLRIRALQLIGFGADFKTSFYDDITFGYVDTGDITTSIEAIAAGSSSGEFDYNADGVIDNADATYYIQTVLLTAFGDTNYDFQVDLPDLQAIADNFGTATSGWENGDLNGDGQVDQADVDLIGANWHHTLIIPNPGVQPTPTGPADFNDALALVGLVIDGIVGDYDDSGQVEQGDLDIVLQNWGTGTFTGNADNLVGGGPFDGTVDQNELDGVLQNWGSVAAPDFAGAAVPEPAALALLGVGGLAMLRRHR